MGPSTAKASLWLHHFPPPRRLGLTQESRTIQVLQHPAIDKAPAAQSSSMALRADHDASFLDLSQPTEGYAGVLCPLVRSIFSLKSLPFGVMAWHFGWKIHC